MLMLGELYRAKSSMAAGTFHSVKREWNGQTVLEISFPMLPRIIERPKGAVGIVRGPLAYALKIEEEWERINEDEPLREPPHCDYEIRPTSPWNYALAIDEESIEFGERPLERMVFSPARAPVTATVMGRRVSQWKLGNEWAGPLPESPVKSSEPLEKLTLIP